jgi:hypothetical protein
LVKVWAKSEAWELDFMLPGMYESVREWSPTLPNELPLWELESQWTPKSSEGDFRNQNSLDWRVICIIGKFLELRCLKWACMIHLGTQNIIHGQKKGRESNCQFDFRPLKIKNRPDFFTWRWHATYYLKALD